MEAPSIYQVSIKKIYCGVVNNETDQLAIEEPLEIEVQSDNLSQPVTVTMRTPGNDSALAAGLLFSEGIISHADIIESFTQNPGDPNRIIVQLGSGSEPNLNKTERSSYSSSACGLCGKTAIEAIYTQPEFKQRQGLPLIEDRILHQLPAKLRLHQELFDSTGGLHAAAFFDPEGILEQLQEDIGRHNALDKLIGTAFLDRALPLKNKILVLSGRAGFELIQKAAMAGIPVIAAIGAPSSLAVSMAKSAGITLVGFLREDRFNIYSHEDRIRCSSYNSVHT